MRGGEERRPDFTNRDKMKYNMDIEGDSDNCSPMSSKSSQFLIHLLMFSSILDYYSHHCNLLICSSTDLFLLSIFELCTYYPYSLLKMSVKSFSRRSVVLFWWLLK